MKRTVRSVIPMSTPDCLRRNLRVCNVLGRYVGNVVYASIYHRVIMLLAWNVYMGESDCFWMWVHYC